MAIVTAWMTSTVLAPIGVPCARALLRLFAQQICTDHAEQDGE
jgi:hypothetical protein